MRSNNKALAALIAAAFSAMAAIAEAQPAAMVEDQPVLLGEAYSMLLAGSSNADFAKNISDGAEPTPLLTMPVVARGAKSMAPSCTAVVLLLLTTTSPLL